MTTTATPPSAASGVAMSPSGGPSVRTESWVERNQRHLMNAVGRIRRSLERRLSIDTPRDDQAESDTSFAAMVDDEQPFALDALTRTFGLSDFERDILVLCAGVELDASFASLIASEARGGVPTFGLALAALSDAHWSAIAPGAPLRAWRLVEVVGMGPATTAPIRIDERVLHYLTGVNHLDSRLRGIVQPLPAPRLGIVIERDSIGVVSDYLRETPDRAIAQLVGADTESFLTVAAGVCEALEAHSLCLRADDIPSVAAERFDLARLLSREASLARAVIVVEINSDADESRVTSLAAALETPMILRSAKFVAALASRSEWFELPVQRARSAWASNRRIARPTMDALAQRIEAIADWNDLVLPEPQLSVLREVATHVRQRERVYDDWGFAAKSARGLGISALFAGPPGTGKTTAAEVLARELKVDLYRVDLSGIVSKYIGETEKNLNRLFSAADGTNVVLLFDEADALFGKRSEVKDSHDRYANIEISYLLQRMESYQGLAILTSNMKQAIDPSFLRRIRFVAHFPFPDADAREAIWRGVFPARTPTADLDFARLAQLNVSGGNIRNIALAAAFSAAEAGTHVTMHHLAQAARAEYAKLERQISNGEFRGWGGGAI